jgi:hypothetical protein
VDSSPRSGVRLRKMPDWDDFVYFGHSVMERWAYWATPALLVLGVYMHGG